MNELINAQIKGLDLKNRSLKVHGKGAKDRKVYFGKKTLQTLRHWMKIRDYSPEKIWEDTIFISQGGEKLKVRNIEQLVSRIQKKASLTDTKVSPHVLRHTAATFAVENGLTAFQLKIQFGWEQIGTALRYVHMSQEPRPKGRGFQKNRFNHGPCSFTKEDPVPSKYWRAFSASFGKDHPKVFR